MTELDNVVLIQLREIRSRIDALGTKMDEGFARLDRDINSLRRTMQGEGLMARYTVAEFDERSEATEKRVAALEEHIRSSPRS